MKQRGEYWVVMCRTCHHPGGLHRIDQWEPRVTHCLCCAGCPSYDNGEYGIWSDALTRDIEADKQ